MEFLSDGAGTHERATKCILVGARARFFFFRKKDGLADHFTDRAVDMVPGLQAFVAVQAFCGLFRGFWIYIKFHASSRSIKSMLGKCYKILHQIRLHRIVKDTKAKTCVFLAGWYSCFSPLFVFS